MMGTDDVTLDAAKSDAIEAQADFWANQMANSHGSGRAGKETGIRCSAPILHLAVSVFLSSPKARQTLSDSPEMMMLAK
jgi:hypothetical protein